MNAFLISELKDVIQEAFDGPSGNGSCFVDSRPNTGIFGTLNQLTAQEASHSINGTVMAAHADHIRYYLWVINEILEGRKPEKDWEESWEIKKVNEAQWEKIRGNLRKEYDAAMDHIESIETEEQYSWVLGDLAHSAYHLGALRQMLKVVKA